MGQVGRNLDLGDLFGRLVSLLIFKQRADSGFGSAHSPPLGPGKPLLLLCTPAKSLPRGEMLSAALSPELVSEPWKGALLSRPFHAFSLTTVICSRYVSPV